MKTLEELKKENGIATIDGVKYILIEQPYVDDIMQGCSSRTMYNARAVREGPRRARGPGPAAEVEDVPRRREERPEAPDDLTHEEEVQRTVVEGEGRALAGALERVAAGHALAPLDVQGREGDERATDLGERERGALPRLERVEERREGVGCVHAGGRGPTAV